MRTPGGPIGLYLHVPYCTVRCSYCDFYLVTRRGRSLDGFEQALRAEIDATGEPLRDRSADSVHFGGGTPSLLTARSIRSILERLGAVFRLAPEAEIALEANPEDIDPMEAPSLVGAGVNRLTVGVQTLDDALLQRMRRPHDSRRALAALDAARRAGVASLGADMMLGLPGQEEASALEGIGRVLDSGVDHVSLYLLELHDSTRLGRAVRLGRITPMADDAAAALYEAASDRLAEAGFEHYEISNFARPGHRSRHNLKYWTDAEYVGFGPSAHSYVDGRRWSNAPDLTGYLAGGGTPMRIPDGVDSAAARGGEALVAGLRLAEGVDLEALRSKYGPELPRPDHPTIADLEGAGLVERAGPRLRLTAGGRLVSNEVFARLIPPVS
jgi:putative oxygen-independent coproporphyrinogen III oxidase